MSLFDDLLAKTQSNSKPTSPSGNGSSGTGGPTGGAWQQDPLMTPITISQSMPIATETIEVEAPKVVVAPVVIPEPSEVTPVEQNDSIIIGSPSSESHAADPLDISIVDEVALPKEEEIVLPEPIPEPRGLSDADWSNEIINNISSDSPLFEMMTESSPSTSPEIQFDAIDSTASTLDEEVAPEVVFHDTAEYIDHALEEVATLMTTLDIANEAKLTEKEDYKSQKEHFAELELQAESEHEKMLLERNKAKKMRTYLEHEKAKAVAEELEVA